MRIWSVWVGGVEVNDFYLTLEEAQEIALVYRDNNFDNIYISAEGI